MQQAAGSRQQAAGSRQQAAGSRHQTTDSRQQTAGSRHQTSDSRQLPDSAYDIGCPPLLSFFKIFQIPRSVGCMLAHFYIKTFLYLKLSTFRHADSFTPV
jgi:hypothetical protein